MNYKNKFHIIILISLVLVCCKQKDSAKTGVDKKTDLTETQTETVSLALSKKVSDVKQSNEEKEDKDDKKEIIVNSDTLTVSGKSIVFFTISQPEYDSYSLDVNSGVDEVLSDFNYHSNQVADTLKKSGYELTMTASRFIRFKMDNGTEKLFDRLASDEHIVGRVYSDGIKTITSYGVGTDIDIITEFTEFRNIK